MCGLAGVVRLTGAPLPPDGLAESMAARLAHRGPDGCGFWRGSGVELAFRRLAIIDPTAPPAPYTDESGNVIAAVNGEIYNYPELLERISERGHRVRTHCDTEVTAHLFEEEGPAAVERLDGMFALAVWDGHARRLVLARDRAGEKPLYWSVVGDRLLFASELQALLACPDLPRDLDAPALSRYLLHDHYPSPATPFRAIRKLPAAHRLVAEGGRIRIERYWSPGPSWEAPVWTDPAPVLEERTLTLLSNSVRRRWVSDVPVGVFLSGGLDSSGIVALLARAGASPLRTFTLGFSDDEFDESEAAARTAARFGARHEMERAGPAELDGALDAISRAMADPLADPSLLPAWLVSRLARRSVTVVLSGEGSDEIFGGYPTYPGHLIAERIRALPKPVRAALRRLVGLVPVTHGNVTVEFLLRRLMQGAEQPLLPRHLDWFGSIPQPLQERFVRREFREAAGSWDSDAAAVAALEGISFRDDLSKVMHLDFSTYLQDGLLTKMDRASMLHSLEVRTPYLDHHLVEFACRIPSALKVRGSRTKILLRGALAPLLPAEVPKRRKRGFSFPVARWIDRDAGGRVRDLLSKERLARQGIFDGDAVQGLLAEHRAGRADNRRPLWNLLTFQLWHHAFVENASVQAPAAVRAAPA